jgi:DNA gyrase subunit A
LERRSRWGLTPCLILSVSDNGYGKRTDVDAYRLQTRGGKGVINMKTSTKIGKVTNINLVDDTTEMIVISQFGKIIRIDMKSVAAPAAAPPASASSTSTPTTR